MYYLLKVKSNYNIVNKQTLPLFVLFLAVALNSLCAQESPEPVTSEKITALFEDQTILPLRMTFSNKEMKRNTNDSTYLLSRIYYENDGSWDSIEVKIRARGNFRREHCYFPPLKVKIKKAVAKETLFKGNKELKVVLPCYSAENTYDNIVKEYMAYKMYELISPYHYKTRMANIEFTELRGNKSKTHQLKAFLIEDLDKVADRHDAKKMKRSVHPLQQDDLCSVQNDFFQYMIGNTDFSVAYQHNEKLIFTSDNKTMPVPYDFDMSGLVDASYAVVSQVQNETLTIEEVTDRLFRGFKRNEEVYRKVRKQFLDNEQKLYAVMEGLKDDFDNPKEYDVARDFIEDFFAIMKNDTKFSNEILKKARTK
jgi:hypothetical protein